MTIKTEKMFFLALIIAGILIVPAFAGSGSWSVNSDNDDVYYQTSTTNIFLTGQAAQVGDHDATYYDLESGFRFQAIGIPQGATITSAYFEGEAFSYIGAYTAIIVMGQDADDTITFSNAADYTGRARTTATVGWTPTTWVTDTRYNSSDIKTIIQEIVDRGGWVSGNDMVIFTTHELGWGGSSTRILMYAYDQDNSKPATLYIEWASYSDPDSPELLFGAGFNRSVPYVELCWDHDLNDTDFFEVQNSTNKVAWDTLGTSTTTGYVDYEVENGTERYYRVRACIDQPDGWHNSTFTDINYEEVNFLSSEPCITVLAGDWATYNASSITVETGTFVHGNITSLVYRDGKTAKINEVTGVPGFDVRVNFTGIPENSTSLSMRPFNEYEGNPAHIVQHQAWHFENKTWVVLETLVEHGFRWTNASLSLGGFIENVTGKVWVRALHVSSGSIGHYIEVDYLRLRAFVPTGGVDPNLDAWSINWLLSLIWIALVTIGIFDRNKIVIMFAGLFGIILALLMMTENMMIAIALICLNLYLLYEGTE